MAASEVYKSKFPATKQLDACYSDVVPDKGVHHATVQRLEDVLSENSTFILINAHLNMTILYPDPQSTSLSVTCMQDAVRVVHVMKVYCYRKE